MFSSRRKPALSIMPPMSVTVLQNVTNLQDKCNSVQKQKMRVIFPTALISHIAHTESVVSVGWGLMVLLTQTSSYATIVHGRGCNPHRCTTTFANVEITSLWRHRWRQNSESIRDRQKRRLLRAMKSSELSNGENRIALRQLLQNRKWCHLWCHNLGSRRKLQKMAREYFSIGAFYNITKNQDNPMKTVGGDSFLSPKTPKIQVF